MMTDHRVRGGLAFAGLAIAAIGLGGGKQANVRPTSAQRIVQGAKDQLTWGTKYDPSYERIAYPNGDVPRNKGVCTDVVIRALRHAGCDLQVLVHKDIQKAWRAYPRYPGTKGPDSNIDHRRVPNQVVFFKRHGRSLPIHLGAKFARYWKPGDLVFWKLDNGLNHVGILSDRINEFGYPYAIHNLRTTAEEDVLAKWKIVGHYRFP